MGLKDSLIGMMGDFVQMNKNPEFRSKTELSNRGDPGTSEIPTSLRLQNRRHSLNITVGTQGPPETFVRPRTYSVSGSSSDAARPPKSPNDSLIKKATKNRRFSAPGELKEPPPTFQLPSARNKSTELSKNRPSSLKKPPTLRKLQAEQLVAESESSDSENEYHRRFQNSPRLSGTGFFKPTGSLLEEEAIAEEAEECTQPCTIKSGHVTVITTRL